ncbi:TPA: hypothetical protein ACGIK9_002942 [Acinetobacter baumannii]|uniref:hypothetical protein n=1 Tax=Acinetobacter baumannii TaxID=470 RepID=UPI00338F509E
MRLFNILMFTCLGLASTAALADYQSEKNQFNSTLDQFGICTTTQLKTSSESGDNSLSSCYKSLQDSLTAQIKKIRLEKKVALNEQTWKEVNLSHQRGVQSCAEISNSVAYSNFTGYLDSNCESIFYISLAQSAIELHYKK